MPDPVKLFKALSSERRLEIVRLLKEHPQCVNALAERLKMTQSAVSQHLRVLREAGLAKAVKRGNWMHYEMPAGALEKAGRLLAGIFGVAVKPADAAAGDKNCPPALLKECRAKKPGGEKRRGGRS